MSPHKGTQADAQAPRPGEQHDVGYDETTSVVPMRRALPLESIRADDLTQDIAVVTGPDHFQQG
jgi:hypothetical protein